MPGSPPASVIDARSAVDRVPLALDRLSTQDVQKSMDVSVAIARIRDALVYEGDVHEGKGLSLVEGRVRALFCGRLP